MCIPSLTENFVTMYVSMKRILAFLALEERAPPERQPLPSSPPLPLDCSDQLAGKSADGLQTRCCLSEEASSLLLTPNADRTVFLFLASVAAATLLCAHTITRAWTNAIRKPQPLSIERLTAGRTSIAWRRRLLCGAPLCSLACL